MIRTATVGGQETASMGRAYFQPRKTVQRPLEDQMGQRHGGCQRISNHVAQVAVSFKSSLTFRESRRVYENQASQFLRLGPKGVKLGRGQLVVVDVGGDHAASHDCRPG